MPSWRPVPRRHDLAGNGQRRPAGDLDQAEACALRTFVRRNAQTFTIHLAKLIGAFRLQKIDPLDKLGGLVRGDEIAGYDIHAAIILGNHDDAEGRLFPVGRPGLRPFDAIADDVLHEFDENREYVPDLRAVARMVLQPLAERVANCQQDVLGHIA